MQWPKWADERWREMKARELALLGKFYDHLLYPFTTETRSDQEYIPVIERRPSAPYNLPRAIAAETRRWLWAGRNCPRLQFEDANTLLALQRLVKESSLVEKMAEATFFGSVGSVALTFQIRPGRDGYPHIIFDCWRAKDCSVTFNDVGELMRLRVQYLCLGRSFIAQGVTKAASETGPNGLDEEIQPDKLYWFTRDYDEQWVTTYRPIAEADYSPADPEQQRKLKPDLERSDAHALGFVPGVWIRNLPGGDHPDGDSTWLPAMNTSITLDYTLSMVPRGLWANLCPQLVIVGDPTNQGVDQIGRVVIRGPSNVIQFQGVTKGIDGQSYGGGSANLLESNGQIFKSATEVIDAFKKTAKEQIQASRKDPDKLTTAQSGVAVNALEEEHMGLVQELRCSYGDDGYIELLVKVAIAAKLAGHPAVASVEINPDRLRDELGLQWPREIISPQDFSYIEPALMDTVERKMVPAQDVADWIRTHLDLPWRPGEKVPEDAGLPIPPPVDPNKPQPPDKGQPG